MQVEGLTLCAIQDKSEIVVKAAETLLLPVTARWALQEKCFHSSLVPAILQALNLSISVS